MSGQLPRPSSARAGREQHPPDAAGHPSLERSPSSLTVVVHCGGEVPLLLVGGAEPLMGDALGLEDVPVLRHLRAREGRGVRRVET